MYSIAMNGWPVVLADVEDRDDVGMAKARRQLEPPARNVRATPGVRAVPEQLDRDEAIDRGIAGEEERPHTSLIYLVQHLVAADEPCRHRRGHLQPGGSPRLLRALPASTIQMTVS